MSAAPSRPSLRGDEAALFARHHRALEHVVAHRVATVTPQTVEDACQRAWVALLRRQPDRATVWPWLITVAVREAIRLETHGRERWPLTSRPLDVDRVRAAEEEELALELRAALEALAALPLGQRQAVALHAAGYTYPEIAALTGATVRTVERRLGAARRTLRERPDAPEPAGAAPETGACSST